jgi:hypothetical protein
MLLGLLFDSPVFITKFGNSLGNIELDANLEENHEWVAEATSNPVEEGAPITDHVIEQSDKIRIHGFISNNPVTSGFLVSQISNVQDVFNLLYDLIKLKEPITVYTKLKVYTDMILTHVSVPKAPGVGDAVEFDAEFIHIRKVATQTVDVPKGVSAKKDAKTPAAVGRKAEPAKDAGKKQATTVDTTKPTKMSSTIFRASQ